MIYTIKTTIKADVVTSKGHIFSKETLEKICEMELPFLGYFNDNSLSNTYSIKRFQDISNAAYRINKLFLTEDNELSVEIKIINTAQGINLHRSIVDNGSHNFYCVLAIALHKDDNTTQEITFDNIVRIAGIDIQYNNTLYNSYNDTKQHIEKVEEFITYFNDVMTERSINHDKSKLFDPEKVIFDEFTPKLKDSTYGSEEYKKFLVDMKPALDHHYKNNSHHPEHYENGINGMNLFDLVEMFCDWCAASLRHENGNILNSIEMNQERFKYSDDLKNILINTANVFINAKRVK